MKIATRNLWIGKVEARNNLFGFRLLEIEAQFATL